MKVINSMLKEKITCQTHKPGYEIRITLYKKQIRKIYEVQFPTNPILKDEIEKKYQLNKRIKKT
jgi:hypothetical protein